VVGANERGSEEGFGVGHVSQVFSQMAPAAVLSHTSSISVRPLRFESHLHVSCLPPWVNFFLPSLQAEEGVVGCCSIRDDRCTRGRGEGSAVVRIVMPMQVAQSKAIALIVCGCCFGLLLLFLSL